MLEICIDSVASARAAAVGRADRVELCSALPEGGTTPPLGLIEAVREVFPGGLMVLIRPRGHDFLYSADEVACMCRDIRHAARAGADGVVIGALSASGEIDTETCHRLIDEAGPLDITFHRAFDMSRDLESSLDQIAGLGIKRILTSGGRANAEAGAPMLRKLVLRAGGAVSLMPGGGVTPENLAVIVRATGAREIHLSGRRDVESDMEWRNEECHMGEFTRGREFTRREADTELISRCRTLLDTCLGGPAAAATDPVGSK